MQSAAAAPAQYVDVWTLFKNRFFYKRNFDANGVGERSAIALARCLQPLKLVSEQGDWGKNDAILISYFVHTFYALDRLEKATASRRRNGEEPIYLAEHNDHLHFRTGLITEGEGVRVRRVRVRVSNSMP